MKTVRFGIIGCGLMGREFASAVGRWCHLTDMDVRPEIVAICDTNDALFPWYQQNVPTLRQVTNNWRELLGNDDAQAVYVAVPHNLHEQVYCAVIESGKHLLGEKPFGIDRPANQTILAALARHPDVFVRCASEFPFFPAVQRIGDMLDGNTFGQIIEANCGFLHSSDLNPDKPINWKRMIDINGEYGVMGDLGMHAYHVPFRAGWKLLDVRAILSNIVQERPDGKGKRVPCKTWDNATLLSRTVADNNAEPFPLTVKVQRIAPGQKNTWYIEIFGTKASARFSTKNPKRLELLEYTGGEQVWQQIDMGQETAFSAITGGIFEFGFSDAILQMWAAFLYELTTGKPLKRFAACVTPDEAALSHRLFTAALQSQQNGQTISLE